MSCVHAPCATGDSIGIGEHSESTLASSAAGGAATIVLAFISVPQKLKARGCRNALVPDASGKGNARRWTLEGRRREGASVMPTLRRPKHRELYRCEFSGRAVARRLMHQRSRSHRGQTAEVTDRHAHIPPRARSQGAERSQLVGGPTRSERGPVRRSRSKDDARNDRSQSTGDAVQRGARGDSRRLAL
jgi:hypothetical protein